MIHSILKRGYAHADFCEDFLITHTFNNGFLLGAVFDGCSSGVDSHFASALFGKALLSICKKYKVEISDKKLIAKYLLKQLATDIHFAKSKFQLTDDELLSTINMMIINPLDDSVFVICIGDGVVNIGSKTITVDQQNIPNYMTYHLDEIVEMDNFDGWFQSEKNIFETVKATDVSVSTDGIQSFTRNPEIHPTTNDNIDPINYMLQDTLMKSNKAMFGRKCNLLKNKLGLMHYDDLGIIRYIKD